jgi:hypothetical protein
MVHDKNKIIKYDSVYSITKLLINHHPLPPKSTPAAHSYSLWNDTALAAFRVVQTAAAGHEPSASPSDTFGYGKSKRLCKTNSPCASCREDKIFDHTIAVPEVTQLSQLSGAQRPTKQIIQTANMRKTSRIKYGEEYSVQRAEEETDLGVKIPRLHTA